MATWILLHRCSEELAVAAEDAARAGGDERAAILYAGAAAIEERALYALPSDKSRTFGITAVSAVHLWLAAGYVEEAQRLAGEALKHDNLPEFARIDLQQILCRQRHDVA